MYSRVIDFRSFVDDVRVVAQRNGCILVGAKPSTLKITSIDINYSFFFQQFLADWKKSCKYSKLGNCFSRIGNVLEFNSTCLHSFDVILQGGKPLLVSKYAKDNNGVCLSAEAIKSGIKSVFRSVVDFYGFSDDTNSGSQTSPEKSLMKNLKISVSTKMVSYKIFCDTPEVAKMFANCWVTWLESKDAYAFGYLRQTMVSPEDAYCLGYVGVSPTSRPLVTK